MKSASQLILLFTLCFSFNILAEHKIQVNLKKQEVTVYAEGKIIKKLPCSTAKTGFSTPAGHFKTHKKVESSYVTEDNTQIDYYFISKFSGERGFHSKLFGNHALVDEGNKLFKERKPSSHGCVRLEFDDAKWLYSLPLGTPVHIF